MDRKKRLTWKYFIQQKVYELLILLGVILGIVFIIQMLKIFAEMYGRENVCLFIFLMFPIIFIGYMLYILIESFIKYNWKKAEQRANKELKNVRKKNKK